MAEETWHPLSPFQRHLWRFAQLEPESRAYNLGLFVHMDGTLDHDRLASALNGLMARHEMLRLRIRDGRQQIMPATGRPLDEEDVAETADPKGEAMSQGHAFLLQPYDLEAGDVFRYRLYRVSAQRHTLAVGIHHIVSDAWSIRLLLTDLMALYNGKALRPVRLRYTDYAQQHIEWEDSDEAAAQKSFWRENLAGHHPVLSLPVLQPPGAVHPTVHHPLSIDASLATGVDSLAERVNATRFNVLLAALQVLLSRLSGQQSVRVGTLASDRGNASARTVGFFVNTLPLTGSPHPSLSVEDWIRQVGDDLNQARDHGRLPLDNLEKDGSATPFHFAFNYHGRRRGERAAVSMGDLDVDFQEMLLAETPFALTLDAAPDLDKGVTLRFIAAEGIFDQAFMQQVTDGYLGILAQFVANPTLPLGSLCLVSPPDAVLLRSWAERPADYDTGADFVDLVSAQAAARPEAPALVHGDDRVSYGALEHRSDAIARWLLDQGAGPETIVGVSLERGTAMIAAFLGILKAGAAFLPLDPDYPPERLRHMLDDSAAPLLLTSSDLVERLGIPGTTRAVALDRLTLDEPPWDTPLPAPHPDQLAYIIYTSGSTGRPKGVAVTRRGLAMHVQTIGQRYAMTPEDVELLFASISFDGAVERWTVPLAFGSRLVIRDQALWSAEQTCDALIAEGVTIACFPPSYVGPLLDWIEHSKPELPLRSWTLGGEAFTRETYHRLQQVVAPPRIINGYGPTETVVTPLIWEAYPDTPLDSAYAPIGTPVGERRAYVLDQTLNPVPPGLVGELYIAGEAGLARGYQGRPDLTAERFLPDPFGPPGERMYRTGDLVRWREDGVQGGVMEYLGRADQQIKVRGFRIEPGEIEARLMALPELREAVVVAQARGGDAANTLLVAYVVPADDTAIDPRAIQARLGAVLPAYMVPSLFVSLEALPLTPAGKVDRQALPAPDRQQTTQEPPEGAAEQAIATIWQRFLKVERIGRQDSFFELGGDSIIALQVVGQARREGWALKPNHLFQHQTLAAVAAAAKPQDKPAQPRGPATGNAKLTPIQARFLKQNGAALCNQYLLLELTEPLKPVPLQAALVALHDHHDALRLRFERHEGSWRQHFLDTGKPVGNLLWQREARDEAEAEDLCTQAQQSLDIEAGVLMRALLLTRKGQPDRLLLTIHHLAVDGVSWRILMEDLRLAYSQAEAGHAITLPARTGSLKDWTETLSRWPGAQAQRDFWQQQETEATALWNGPPTRTSQNHSLILPADIARRAEEAAKASLRGNLDDLLYTALALTLARHYGRPTVRLHRESHGRSADLAAMDLSRTVGWFTSLYPLSLNIPVERVAAIKSIKEQIKTVDHLGLGYGALVQSGSLEATAQPEVLFNYLGRLLEVDGMSLRDSGLWRPAHMRADAPLVVDVIQQPTGEVTLQVVFSHTGIPLSEQHALLAVFEEEIQAVIRCCEDSAPWLTPSDVPLAAIDQAKLDSLSDEGIEDVLPLTPLQQGLLFHTRLSQDSDTYVNQLTLPLKNLDPKRFEVVWQELMQRHPVLRSAPLDHEGLQGTWRSLQLPWQFHTLESKPDVEAICAARRNFDLQHPPLWHIDLIQTADDTCVFVLTLHHLMMDGWSTTVLLDEAMRLYRGETLSPAPPPFSAFLDWMQKQNRDAARTFWHDYLDGFGATLLAAGQKHDEKDFRRHTLALPGNLQEKAQRLQVTQSTLMQGAWALALARHSGNRRVVFGNTVAGRPPDLTGSEEMIGLFINTLPVAVEVPATNEPWLPALQQSGAEAREYGHLPLSEIQSLAGHAADGLFDSLMVFENYPGLDDLPSEMPGIYEFTHYPLTLAVLPGAAPRVVFAYNAALLTQETIEALAEGFETALNSLTEGGSALSAELHDLPAEALSDRRRGRPAYEAPQGQAEETLATIWRDVLEADQVGRQDNFFDLGGHSLLALRIVGLARSRHGLQLPLQALFDHPRLADCAAQIQATADKDPALVSVRRDGNLPASPAQRRLWFIQQLAPGDGAYHIPLGLDLEGDLNTDALVEALNRVVARHEILRTRFVAPDGALRQHILAHAPVAIELHDLRSHPNPLKTEIALFKDWLERPFDLALDPLLRLGVVQHGEKHFRLLLVQHHIITDGRSIRLFLHELIETYGALLNGTATAAEKSELQYADYAAWYRGWLESPAAGRQLDYWRETLAPDAEPIELPTDFPRDGRPSAGARLPFRLTPALAQSLQALAKGQSTTLFAPLLAVWMLLLHRYSGQETITVGVPVSGRSRPETEDMLGCFINVVTLQARIDLAQGFSDLMKAVAGNALDAQRHQGVPFETVVQGLGAGRNHDRHPLFQVVFNHQQDMAAPFAGWPGAEVTAFDPGSAGAQFDLALDTEAHPDGSISGYISYNSNLFRGETAERLLNHYLRLLEAASTEPKRALGGIHLLSAAEDRELQIWNETAKDWGDCLPVPVRQSRQAARTPDAIAVSYGSECLTYGELERRVNQLAHRLRRAGVGPEVRVAVSLKRSVELVLAILAVVRAGGSYVPLDPGYPAERMQAILEEASPILAFSETELDGIPCWQVNDPANAAEPVTPPQVSWHPDQAIYAIYTSGSTGRPKGVINTHAALENRLLWMQQAYPLKAGDCVLQKTPFSFDVSVWEFFWPFMTGARLAIAPPDAHGDPQALRAVIDAERVSTLHFVPSMLQAALPELTGCTSIERIICSGEALSPELKQETLATLPRAELHNLYGPTEAAIDVSYWHCREDERSTVPIGRPIANIRLQILDSALNPVPVGVPGELYLSGVGLARGYLGRPDLTAERFLPDPFGPPGSRMYRTGDLVRREAEGVIDYLGRLDQQVKIRGLRVELGEVETWLRRQEDIADAAVIAHGDLLAAYVVPKSDLNDGWQGELKTALTAQLPDYMVPTLFTALDAFPLSSNGKLNRKALPRPEGRRQSYRAPQTAIQKDLATVWQEVLDCTEVGLDDNFFDLGGYSLAAIRAIALVRARLDRDVPLRTFIESQTLEALAAQLEAGDRAEDDLEAMAALLDEVGS
ncbi:amino acid adenylation domain-containing protein [Pelagibius sp.]|uniref:amino acid adenylation domain-containing protein n=1 Tax=Pelagibius sp. TaxID=1931238 RepID=UPI003BAEA599